MKRSMDSRERSGEEIIDLLSSYFARVGIIPHGNKDDISDGWVLGQLREIDPDNELRLVDNAGLRFQLGILCRKQWEIINVLTDLGEHHLLGDGPCTREQLVVAVERNYYKWLLGWSVERGLGHMSFELDIRRLDRLADDLGKMGLLSGLGKEIVLQRFWRASEKQLSYGDNPGRFEKLKQMVKDS